MHLTNLFKTRSAIDQKAGLYNEIRKQIYSNKGLELPGMSNPAVLKPLFRKQTSKWEKLGQDHLESIVRMSQDVAMEILAEVCKTFKVPTRTKNDLEDVISGFKDHAEREATERLRTFCLEITTFPLQTSNKLFLKKITEAQHARFRGALERYRKTNPPDNFLLNLMTGRDPANLLTIPQVFGSWAIVDLNNITELFDQMHPRGVQNTEDEIHDLLKAYYEVSYSASELHHSHKIRHNHQPDHTRGFYLSYPASHSRAIFPRQAWACSWSLCGLPSHPIRGKN
jgi:hypothetical protein